MERRTPLKRTPMKRGVVRMSAVSATKKRRREQAAGPSMADLRPLLWKRCAEQCERCGRSVTFDGFEAHHRKFRSRGGLDEIVNLTALCGDCHRWAHGEALQAVPAGYSVLRSEDPRLIPMRIHGRLPVYLTAEGGYTRKTPEPDLEEA